MKLEGKILYEKHGYIALALTTIKYCDFLKKIDHHDKKISVTNLLQKTLINKMKVPNKQTNKLNAALPQLTTSLATILLFV